MKSTAAKLAPIQGSDPGGKIETFNFNQLRERYEKKASRVLASCTLSTDMIGGLSADRQGIENFVANQLKLTGNEAAKAVARILEEEIGERDIAPADGELKEKLSYGINVVRRSEHGPWLKDHMLKACLKCSASRLGIFMAKRGPKGGMVEMGEIKAVGTSLIDLPHRIYFRTPDGKHPAKTFFQQFKGRVSTPQGSKSIINDCECVPAGSIFSFEYHFFATNMTKNDVVDIFASAMIVGIGSAKSFECGKFAIDKLEVEM